MRERVGDQALPAGMRNEGEADQHPPSLCRLREDRVPARERNRKENERADGRAHCHEVQRRLAAVAQPLHGEEVAGVEDRGDDAERVAHEPGGRESDARMHQQRDTGERRGETGQEEPRRPLAQKDPGREGDEDRREVGEQRGIGHRRELDRGVPEGEVAGPRVLFPHRNDARRLIAPGVFPPPDHLDDPENEQHTRGAQKPQVQWIPERQRAEIDPGNHP